MNNENLPEAVISLLDIPAKTREQETALEMQLYWVAKNSTEDQSLRQVTNLFKEYGSSYSKASWWKIEAGTMYPNTRARNAIRRWANTELGLSLAMVPPTLGELESIGIDTRYLLRGTNDPELVLVIGEDADEVVVHNLSQPAIEELGSLPNVSVTVVTGRRRGVESRKGQRLGLSLTRVSPGESFRSQKEAHDMTYDEFVTHLLAIHALHPHEHYRRSGVGDDDSK